MTQLVSITSQGQISIPAKIRRELGLEKYRKAIVRKEKDHIVIKPVKDLLDLGGSLQHLALKDKKIEEILQIEEEAVAAGFAGKLK